jgi:hypothetical protein
MTSNFIDHYIVWRKSRIDGLEKYLNSDFLSNKTLLELGCGTADVANALQLKGAIVTACDARKEHLDIVNVISPDITTFIYDGDKDLLETKYDIILHWGLLYHLAPETITSHLNNILLNCDYLLLETEVCDADDIRILATDEEGYDQAYNGRGSRPSQKYVEKIIEDNNFSFMMIKDNILNASIHSYDWDITNTKTWRHGLRRYWICWNKNKECPIKQELL